LTEIDRKLMAERDDHNDMQTRLDDELLADGLRETRASAPQAAQPGAMAGADATQQFRAAIADIAATVLKIPLDRLDVRENMSRYGVDSIIVTEIMRRISDLLDRPIAPTVFFEARHLEGLADILRQRYGKAIAQRYAEIEPHPATKAAVRETSKTVDPPRAATAVRSDTSADVKRWIDRFRAIASGATSVDIPAENSQALPLQAIARHTYEPVAIIAMEGTFAQSVNIAELEAHLRAGDDCIREIPPDRWDWRQVFGDPRQGEFTNVKYGGFAPDIDKFDPLFFGMSPREAELMDPQHRLFIQCCWKLIEQAGYAPRSLSGRKVGVFIGINLQDYAHLVDRAGEIEAAHLTSLGHMFCPNRLSFHLDIHGPSQVIDTACSSSLVALHRAALAVQHEGCEMAIAGGANLLISPDMHVMYSKVGMICEDGRCKTFSRHANGYARGDGVGAVLLKPLRQAERDGDAILAVIRGSAENHGGMSTSLTAPNPRAQADLIVEAHRKAGIDPRSVGYIECHGTGTSLGDPIEINGLKMAFAELYREGGISPAAASCGLGSIKSNIGHAETAAGIAGIIKAVLSLRNRRIYPTLHCGELNPMIELDGSPFFIAQQGAAWQRAVVDGREQPRRAGVSSFGAGGSNAHVVIEEYVAKQRATANAEPALIVLSARNEARLKELATNLARFIDETPDAELPALSDIAYTLQAGREVMADRLAFVAKSFAELRAKLTQIRDGDVDDGIHRGTIKRGAEPPAVASTEDLLRLAPLWTSGARVDWQALHAGTKRRRVHLPTYPFAKQRHWIDVAPLSPRDRRRGGAATLHPLLHREVSDLSGRRFIATFSGREFFLADHVVAGEKVLPGVAYLEMARAAIRQASAEANRERSDIRLRNVVWAQPFVHGAAAHSLYIGLTPEQDGRVAYRITSVAGPDREPVLHGQGTALLAHSPATADTLDLAALCRSIADGELDAGQCYVAFAAMGIVYGPAHQCIESVSYSAARPDAPPQVLARLVLPDSAKAGASSFVLHPGLIDSALQSCIGLMAGSGRVLPTVSDDASDLTAALPFGLDEFEVLSQPLSALWAWVRYADGSSPGDRLQKLDIDLCDEGGRVCVRMRGFSSRMPDEKSAADKDITAICEPVWTPQALAVHAGDASGLRRIVVLCDVDRFFPLGIERSVAGDISGVRCVHLPLRGAIHDWYTDAALGVFDAIRVELGRAGTGQSLVQVVVPHADDAALLEGLAGLIRTANRESTAVFAQLIVLDSISGLAARLEAESFAPIRPPHVRYLGHTREVLRWQEIERRDDSTRVPWKDSGVYLITGGTGGLGLMLARDIAQHTRHATVVLCGRWEQRAETKMEIERLKAIGLNALFRQCDIAQRPQVDTLIDDIVRSAGRLDGVLHCAGLLRDNFIANKTAQEFRDVFAPKVSGTLHLDDATKDLDLDIFVLFASASGVLGSAGQADYAAANAFMDAFAHRRNALAMDGARRGWTVSIDWPLWADGGMRMEASARAMMRQTTGMDALPNTDGLRTLHMILASAMPQALVLHGTCAGIDKMLSEPAPPTPVRERGADDAIGVALAPDTNELRIRIARMLLDAVTKLMKFAPEDIDANTEWNDLGFDSISLTDFSNRLNQQYRLDITPTVFFEYPTPGALSSWLATAHGVALASALGVSSHPVARAEPPKVDNRARARIATEAPVETAAQTHTTSEPAPSAHRRDTDAIAIVGMSGRFPMARDLDEFWNNLLAGRDCITEIPPDRWDWKAIYGDPEAEPNKTNIKWGGFIDGAGDFDARFFGISPREAERMDPQQRLLMQYAWKAIEDAGYSAASLAGSSTGMFIATAPSGYAERTVQNGAAIESYSSTGAVGSIGPNRMSYFLNIHGPSEPIETACSSSLIAIHRAITAIAGGDCEQAIAGGLNLVVSPETHVSFNKAGMLSPDGRCKTFSRHANGYVRGEGVGMLFLKKLSAAERDGDHIHGVIRGSAENHGGRANSLTAPNPKAQTELLKTAYARAGIDPRTVGYIEAHGTGTELGDPIEVDSLKAAFRDLYAANGVSDAEAPHCGLGSVKTNIGHLELAAGIAGVIKVLLQLRHKTLVRTLHCEDVNPYVRLDGSPFYLVTENREWAAPRDADGRALPRRAGVSSFGFGGVNAHLVIEEYLEPQREAAIERPSLIVLSAKNAERLRASAESLLSFVTASRTDMPQRGAEPALSDTVLKLAAKIMGVARDNMELARPLDEYGIERVHRLALHAQLQEALGTPLPASAFLKGESLDAIIADLLAVHPELRGSSSRPLSPHFRLSDLAYTLQVGRDAMDERLAFVAESAADLADKLRAFIAGQPADGIFVGQVKQNKSVIASFSADEELREALEKWIARGKFDKLLDLWVKGLSVDWQKLYGEGRPYPLRPRRISAPGYPFAEQRFWIDPQPAAKSVTPTVTAALHPLLHENVSTLRQVRFATQFTGAEFFLADHRVSGQRVLPGVAYLEMARAAMDAAGAPQPKTTVNLRDVVWVAPVTVEQPRRVLIELAPAPDGATRFEIVSEDGERLVHSHGQVSFADQAEPPHVELAALRASGMTRFDGGACYALFAASGLDYGPAHRGIVELYAGGDQALARLALPAPVARTLGQYVLHPSLMDCALQASIGLVMGRETTGEPKMALPFAVETVDVFGDCTNSMWAWVRRRAGSSERVQKVDIDLCDEQGRICVRIGGFSARLFDADKRLRQPVLAKPQSSPPAPSSPEPADLKRRAIGYFKELLATTLGFPVDEIRADDALDSYGIDSMMVMELTRILERPFGPLSKTLFFEYQTLADLVDHFLADHIAQVRALLDERQPASPAPVSRSEAVVESPARPAPVVRPQPQPTAHKPNTGALDIAIIGLSGRYPLARDIEAYWKNLREGRDCITEVPPDRWDWRAYYSDDGAQPHTCKWGGFIEDVDKFDPLFFNISPSTAEYMDPQERLFLEHAWMAMEDAGYRREDLQRPRSGVPGDDDLPAQVGVYAGVMYGEYQLLGLEAVQNGRIPALANFYASIANRVSYALNLHGPSMAVDTMCSSSLTAIHLACQDLALGNTELAFAGGVNVNLHPNKYGLLSLGQFISKNGKCESFGDGGDGYVPSEGVGIVLLKRLADAEHDGDHIYGVIKSSTLNHGGKTNGYSVPNPKAQEAAISRALRDAGADPRAIGYIEAHGTGTRLGDPIEIAGLARAFARHRPDGTPCWIGSSKSNIGHSEAAAGIAGLTKVLLQMRAGEIAPSLHSATLNPNIDFATTPFHVNQELRAWPRPVIDGEMHLRCAGISSFGAGGANAHLIVEEYARPDAPDTLRAPEPHAIVLSARTDEQLRQSAEAMLQFMHGADVPPLRDVAYTLQVGREAMPQRLGFVVASMSDLADKLGRFLRGDRDGMHAARAKRRDSDKAPHNMSDLIAHRRYDALLASWVEGAEPDWHALYPADPPSRVSLPTYPFARERYWIGLPDAERRNAGGAGAERTARVELPAPQADLSTLLLQLTWQERAAPVSTVQAGDHLVFTIGSVPQVANAAVTALRSNSLSADRSFRDVAVQLFEQIKQTFRGKPHGLFQVIIGSTEHAELCSALAAMLRTARLENPQFTGQLVELDDASLRLTPDELASQLRREDGSEPHIRYRSGRREVPAWSELTALSAAAPWREGGTYMITGGAGALGLIFAREIVRRVSNVTLMLTGRSQLDAARQAQLDELRAQGARINYRVVDVCNRAAVDVFIASIAREGGALNGILHSAGVTRDSFLVRKSAADFDAVLDAKVSGIVNLDLATRGIDLDFFVLFSSVSGALGNPGQSDYATANAFMDAYAGSRNRLAASDVAARPRGHTLSINWPLWEHGGMTLDGDAKEAMWRNAGLRPLRTADGIEAFYGALHSGLDQAMVLQGDAARVRTLFADREPPAETKTAPAAGAVRAPSGDKEQLAEKTRQLVAKLLSEMVKLPLHRIETDVALEEYGVDSVGMMKLTNDLEKLLGPLPKTLFFEYPTIADVAAYLAETFAAKLSTSFDVAAPAARPMPTPAEPVVARPVIRAPKPAPLPITPAPEPKPHVATRDIAIIGMSGRFPMANDLDTFWQNLAHGRDCITEVPRERWDHARHFDPDRSAVGKTYCKWGGFLDGVDHFDARFFRIPPAEAELLDPQERLFLETVWNLLESSGTLGETLARYDGRAGVFVGSMSQQYHAFASDWVRSSIVSLTAPASIANRVSYFFDLQGPSIAIDTMCSSALTAIHMACESLLKGECRIAIAGGVNLTIHPKKYIALSAGQMIGSSPDSTSFGDGDGYLPAEGVGAVLLKPLHAAIADGDEILAVIKSTATNHGGQSNGYRVPSKSAQADLIADNFTKSGIDPRTISYVESAANGSPLGDAIEVSALSAGFRQHTADRQFCAIGSVKSNMGHAEAASGMAQLIKVILQMRHRQLAPTIKAEPLNPSIAFEDTPFRLQRSLEEWRQPAIALDGGAPQVYPRRATVSSFGAGGSNAHLIVEEYEARTDVASRAIAEAQLVPLSAKTPSQLRALAQLILTHVEQRPDIDLADVAYTLQIAREAMACRLAVVVEGRDQFIATLGAWLGDAPSPRVLTGNDNDDNSEIKTLLSGRAGKAMLDVLLAERDLEKLALYWVKGIRIAWQPIHAGRTPRRVALPTYPFERKRHWIAEDVSTDAQPAAAATTASRFNIDPGSSPQANMERYLREGLAHSLGIPEQGVCAERSFQDYGANSIVLIRLRQGLEQAFGVEISARDALAHPTPAALAAFAATKIVPVGDHEASNTAAAIRSAASERLPISEGQKGLWLLHQMTPQSSAYNVPIALRFGDGFDVAAFRRSCEHVLRRHPVLGSTFAQHDGEPYRLIHAMAQPGFMHERIEPHEEAKLIELLRLRSREPFDLERGPLLRVHMLSSGENHYALITVHHIVIDGRSAALLLRELAETYAALCAGRNLPAPRPDTRYDDFVAWQQQFMASDRARRQRDYWLAQLSGELPVLALPCDRPHAARRSGGASQEAALTPETARAVRDLARACAINLPAVFLGAWSLLLHRYAGDDDMLIGMPTLGRPDASFDDAIGYFVNMIVVRSRVAGTQRTDDFLKVLQLTIAEGLDNADYPFPALLHALKANASEAAPRVMFACQNFVRAGDVSPAMNFVPGIHQEGTHDLALELYESTDSFNLRIDYDIGLFEPDTIRRAMAHYVRLLEQVVACPSAALAEHDILLPEERRQILAWSTSAPAVHTDGDIVAMIRQQAEATPRKIALVCGEHAATYRELDNRSTRLADVLRDGISPGDAVGVCMARGVDMIVALLAVWKAGRTYVPLAPDLPEQRLRHMIDDSAIKVVITDDAARDRIAAALPFEAPRCIGIGERRRRRSAAQPANFDPDRAAYILYTSGSTGQPKGVVVPHRAIGHHAVVMREHYRLAAQDKVLQFAAMSVDAALEQILPGLTCGATIVIRPDALWSASEFQQTVAQHGITVADLPPPYLHEVLLDASGRDALRSLRLVITGGEALAPETLRLWRNSPLHECRLINAYGPTETTITSTTFEVTDAIDGTVPIGRPLPGERVFILDREGRPVPVGVPGELHIGGAGVATGYLNQPELTAGKFIANPFNPGDRLYRTGDHARWLSDGSIAFLGRIDHQVKVRGFRVECGEVEAALRETGMVRQAAVVPRPVAGSNELVAFVVRKAGEAGELKQALRSKLPDHMIPATIVEVDALPLTPGGKVDGMALTRRDLAADQTRHAPANTLVEKQLAEIWCETLQLVDIGINDDFFARGGHSLLAVRVASLIRQRMGNDIAVSALFAIPTIAAQAKLLDIGATPSPLVCLKADGEHAPWFCIHAVAGDVLAYRELARSLSASRPIYALQAPVADHPGTVEGLASLYIAAIRTVQSNGPYHLGGWSMGGVIACEMAQQLRAAGERVATLSLIDSYTPDAAKAWEHANNISLAAGIKTETYDANIRAMDRYVPRPYDGDARLFHAGTADSGWAALIGKLTTVTLPGDHDSIMRQPAVQQLAEALSDYLDDDTN
jgi:polyketide synthase PksN